MLDRHITPAHHLHIVVPPPQVSVVTVTQLRHLPWQCAIAFHCCFCGRSKSNGTYIHLCQKEIISICLCISFPSFTISVFLTCCCMWFSLLCFSYVIFCIWFHIDCHCLWWYQWMHSQTLMLAGIYMSVFPPKSGQSLTGCIWLEWGLLQEIHHLSLGCYAGFNKALGNISRGGPSISTQWLSSQAGCFSECPPIALVYGLWLPYIFCWWCYLSSYCNLLTLAGSFVYLRLKWSQ